MPTRISSVPVFILMKCVYTQACTCTCTHTHTHTHTHAHTHFSLFLFNSELNASTAEQGPSWVTLQQFMSSRLKCLLLLPALQPTVGFSLLSDFLPFCPFLTQLSPPSYSHYLYIFFDVLKPSFPWSSSVSPTCWFPL